MSLRKSWDKGLLGRFTLLKILSRKTKQERMFFNLSKMKPKINQLLSKSSVN